MQAAIAAHGTQATESAEAQNMIDERNAALDDLRDWMGDYIAAAHVALEDHPQLLEALGIVVPSKGAARAKSVDTPATPAS